MRVPARTVSISVLALAVALATAMTGCIERGVRFEAKIDQPAAPGVASTAPTKLSESDAETAQEPEDAPISGTVSESSDVDDAALDALVEAVEAELPVGQDDGGDVLGGGFDGARIVPLTRSSGAPGPWLVHTVGGRLYEPRFDHFIAVFDRVDGEWLELDRIDLTCPDYLGEASVTLTQPQPPGDALWLTADGGIGAHSGCFQVVAWDGAALELELLAENTNGSPGAGWVEDLDGDDSPEVVLDHTEPYIFCYACGVRLFDAEVMRWVDGQLEPVVLERLDVASPESGVPAGPGKPTVPGAPAAAAATKEGIGDAALGSAGNGGMVSGSAAQLNDRAIDLAEASLYPEALDLLANARELAPDNSDVRWNALLIELFAQHRGELAEQEAYPALTNVFYGDYAKAVDALREHPPEAIFSLDSPLIIGTPAEGWTEELSTHLATFADGAIAVSPDNAAAHFMRAWGRYLADPADPAVIEDVARAADLVPTDELFRAAMEYLGADGG